MAYAVGSLNPTICSKLEEAESLLVDRSETDKGLLSQILNEHGLLTEDELSSTKASLHILFDHIRSHCSDKSFTEVCQYLRARGCNLIAYIMGHGKGNKYNVSVNKKSLRLHILFFTVLQTINFSLKVRFILM